MTRLIGAALAACLALHIGAARAGDSGATLPADCAAPQSLLAIRPALPESAARVQQKAPLTIVAMGSSSTEGIGASTPARNYPSRLEAELRERFPDVPVRVLNRGKGGEDAGEEMARLDRDVIAEHPDLVVWQVGTNAVLRRDDLAVDGGIIERGIARLKDSGSDVVLMDLQVAPRVLARPAYAEIESLLANIAKSSKVGLFRRFDIMRHWQQQPGFDPASMIGPDGLHMTDRGYGCLAADLAEALAWNWWAQIESTSRAPQIAVLGANHDKARALPVATSP